MTASTLKSGVPECTQPGEQDVKISSHSDLGKIGSITAGEDIQHSKAEEKSLLRKIDWNILPLLTISYLLQFLDKTSLGNTGVMGIIADTKLVGQEFSWLSSVFYFGYLAASYPMSVAFVKFPLAKVLSISAVLWAITLGCHGAAQKFAGLVVLRIFLGAFESAISPGFSLMTGIWYDALYLAFSSTEASLSILKEIWLFIILGVITFLWGLVLLVFLPDTPLTARFLNSEERKLAEARPQKKQHSFKDTKWEKAQFIEAMIDPKTWMISVIIGVGSLANGVVANFGSLIITSLGFDTLTTLLFNLPGAGVSLVAVVTLAGISSRVRRSRIILCIVSWIITIVGILLIRQLPTSNKYGRLVGAWLMNSFAASFPLLLSLLASNVTGFTKKTTVQAHFFIVYCAGNIAGPQLFIEKEAPHYLTAYNGCLGSLAVAIGLAVILRFYLDWENKRRDKEQGVYIDPEAIDIFEHDLDDMMLARVIQTDWENRSFRYYL
ncbi:Major facilitator superfamily domain, general substrate transporter [Penicillium expansum]|uniref:Major facilitator superfamily domain, general substrate transporter n=1 Tax=Penicillium expansum TaxID=27334 RepID=A0A0A2IHT9_PENEN|nr:Major facilitator superfamily domain, general substrate transporter [Penicillium expansum]KGO39840.1 Major facilitator superfamily domain, general substrate transporter [Penicillium expansum]KGO50631.1 Major facilitator superfamily domain, general substrate transporter [Penicillium expansum]KGO61225.1 Major facilitator superfamily domain, general substrate transporter [Penicillium expansum]